MKELREFSKQKQLNSFNETMVKKNGSLAEKHPELVKEWDYEKNSESPEDVLYTGKKKYYWKCPLGHSWKTMIYLRTKMHHGCPECNKFGTSFPEQAIYYYIQSVYKDAINGYTELEMELDIYIPSIKVAIEYDGYKFHYGKINRDNRKDDLCFEKGIKLIRIREQGLAQTKIAECIYRNHPDDYQTLDEVIKALFIAIDNNLKIEIHVREDQLKIRSNYYQSLQESSLCIKFPQLAKEWCYEKNEQLTPNMFLAGSSVKVWWQCSKYSNHFWQDSIAHRTSLKRGCPICAGQKILEGFNDLQTRAPLLVQEWSSNNKCKASEVAPSTSKKYLWKCGKCQEEYLASPANRLKGRDVNTVPTMQFCKGKMI